MSFCSPLWLIASALPALNARTVRAAADNATRCLLLPLHDDKSISLSSRYSSFSARDDIAPPAGVSGRTRLPYVFLRSLFLTSGPEDQDAWTIRLNTRR